MLKQLRYIYDFILKNTTYLDFFVLFIVTLVANEWFALIGLAVVCLIDIIQIYAAVIFEKCNPSSAFYRGSRKIIVQCLTMFCTAVAVKMLYLIAFFNIDFHRKSTLIFEVIFCLIILPNFSNWHMRYESAK